MSLPISALQMHRPTTTCQLICCRRWHISFDGGQKWGEREKGMRKRKSILCRNRERLFYLSTFALFFTVVTEGERFRQSKKRKNCLLDPTSSRFFLMHVLHLLSPFFLHWRVQAFVYKSWSLFANVVHICFCSLAPLEREREPKKNKTVVENHRHVAQALDIHQRLKERALVLLKEDWTAAVAGTIM